MNNLQSANGTIVTEQANTGSLQFGAGESLGTANFIPRQKPVRMPHPDLHHLVGKEAFFRSRRRASLFDNDGQPGCEVEQSSDANGPDGDSA